LREIRVTAYFRLLNDMKMSDSYPIEEFGANLDWLRGKKSFSTFDLKDGSFQVMLCTESFSLTAVRTVVD
jgi:hypothetical protein